MNENTSGLPALQNTNYSIAEVQPVSTDSLVKQVQAIQHAMQSVMEDGVHFGKIPGCGEKPALLKPGAEKIGLMFRLGAHFDVEYIDLQGGHREVKVICTLKSIQNGQIIGQGVGSCSTMESKYRYAGSELELTHIEIPKSYWNTRSPEILSELVGGTIPAKLLAAKKNENGVWVVAIKGEKSERKDLADVYNTVLKMAKKRAHVDAIITATAAGDIFTQDIEDGVGVEAQAIEVKQNQQPQAIPVVKPIIVPVNEMPAMDAQPTEAGVVSYNIPYKVSGEDMDTVRKVLKSKKFRFNGQNKFWEGREVIPSLAKYRVIDSSQVETQVEEQPPLPESFESDDLPWEQGHI